MMDCLPSLQVSSLALCTPSYRRVWRHPENRHIFHEINALSVTAEQEDFIVADESNINLWKMDRTDLVLSMKHFLNILIVLA